MFGSVDLNLLISAGLIGSILVGVVLLSFAHNKSIKRNKAMAVAEEERIKSLPLLINCPACQKVISRAAGACPSCGHPISAQPGAASIQRSWSPGVAAVLSLIIPGLGQIYRGQILAGIFWFIFVVGGYFFFIIPGIVLHLICIFSAASGGSK